MADIRQQLQHRLTSFAAPAGGLVVALLAWADARLGAGAPLWLLAVLPVGLVALAAGRTAALRTAGLFGLATLFLAAGRPDGLFGAEALWFADLALRTAFLAAAALAAAAWRSSVLRGAAVEAEWKDSRSGLVGRDLFFARLDHEVARHARYQRPYTLAYLSVDEFETVVYRQGEETGTLLLRTVGSILQANLRDTDTAARTGETEFAILLPETDAEAGAVVCRKLQERLQAAVERNGWPASFSLGAVTPVDAQPSVRELAQHAYQRLHTARTARADHIDFGELVLPAA